MKLIEYYLEKDNIEKRILFSEEDKNIFKIFKEHLLYFYKLNGLEYYEIVGVINIDTIKGILNISNIKLINVEYDI